ncbi:FecR family protein [Dyadobacter sp. CY312]|uniref:FecR family protein n=1 Tax=Dyadobacter sp. CY312 TaxID=2907303 RepID=UPI001F22C0B8|nr:FecR domain-containing protein [Dyadobacter sp. CY312]MCE7040367.1 FecR domain-containing protein [Dyadobacter sp. CY312]
MKKSEYLELSDKYLAGTLSPEEELRFLKVCKTLENKFTAWDDKLMDDQQVVKERLFNRIVADIQQTETSVLPIRKNAFTWRLALAASFLLGCLFIVYTYRAQLADQFFPVQTIVVQAQIGKLIKKELPDGTMVWLNSGSSLTFPEKFNDSTRAVTLSGEAYFDVVRNTEMPFVIQSGQLNTRVLGTRFVIKAYPNDAQSQVAVVSGKVAVKQRDEQETITLLPQQQVTADHQSGTMSVKENIDSLSMMSWTTGRLAYRKSNLAEVLNDLERRYSIEIEADKHLLKCLIYTDVLPGDSARFVLDQLAASLEGAVKERAPGKFRITGKGCK